MKAFEIQYFVIYKFLFHEGQHSSSGVDNSKYTLRIFKNHLIVSTNKEGLYQSFKRLQAGKIQIFLGTSRCSSELNLLKS
jgi:hypothetical protein